jgi:hypothetical protein
MMMMMPMQIINCLKVTTLYPAASDYLWVLHSILKLHLLPQFLTQKIRLQFKFSKSGPKQTVAQLCSFIPVDMVYLKISRCFLGMSHFHF